MPKSTLYMYTRSQRSVTLQDYYVYTRWSLVIIFVVLIIICFGSFANAATNEKLRLNNKNSVGDSFIIYRFSILKFTSLIKPDSTDIYVSKNVSISTAVLGQSFDYTINTGNQGPSVSKHVLVIDNFLPV